MNSSEDTITCVVPYVSLITSKGEVSHHYHMLFPASHCAKIVSGREPTGSTGSYFLGGHAACGYLHASQFIYE